MKGRLLGVPDPIPDGEPVLKSVNDADGMARMASFLSEYEALCEKHCMKLVGTDGWCKLVWYDESLYVEQVH